jgi:hypothetical protein
VTAAAPRKSAASAPDATDQQRKRADNLAHTNQCDEAVKVYGEIERRQRLTAQERANLVRCLGILGRPYEAQQQLDALKQDKSANSMQVRQAESELEAARRVAPKKAKKSVPAASPAGRAADQQTEQQLLSPAK